MDKYADLLRQNGSVFSEGGNSLAFAHQLDSQDELRHLRSEFITPTEGYFRTPKLDQDGNALRNVSDKECVYLVAHGQGLQPKAVRFYVNAQLEAWATIGLRGHYTDLENSPLVQWQDMAENCAMRFAPIVGCLPSEVAVMNGLSVNLHLMMATFYRPTLQKHKIIMEWSPFPSDQYVIESQVKWHGLHQPDESIVKISPDSETSPVLSTESILRVIEEHAAETAVLLLPGIHYYSGQLFDIPTITAYAKKRGIVVGWDMAHAVGNVELQLHDWKIDFACWCNYKYINGGPGSLGGIFVHQEYGSVADVTNATNGTQPYRPRLEGWYGSEKGSRYTRDSFYAPLDGAAGYQISNPPAIELAALSAALSVFDKTTMHELRSKSLVLTAYMEYLFQEILNNVERQQSPPFSIMTPRDPGQRGAQLSIRFQDAATLESVAQTLQSKGFICDVRKPDLMRISPAPLYIRFQDVWLFVAALREAIKAPP